MSGRIKDDSGVVSSYSTISTDGVVVGGTEVSLVAGTELGRYVLKDPIGEGGMGLVLRAHDRERDMEVALKVMRTIDPASFLLFKNEFRARAHLSHPNLVDLHELVAHEGLWFFTMELIEGVDILKYIRGAEHYRDFDKYRSTLESSKDGTNSLDDTIGTISGDDEHIDFTGIQKYVFPPLETELQFARLRDTMSQLVKAVLHVHQAGLLHRDIKPPNVMVTGEGRAVLLDFGVVTKLAEEKEGGSRKIVGTPAYMSPEQAGGLPVSPASDWYSVGVVIYEALSGRRPISGRKRTAVQNKQQVDAAPIGEIPDFVPHDLLSLCTELLERSPNDRPPGEEIAFRLDRAGAVDRGAERRTIASAPISAQPLLVGRESQLAILSSAFDEVCAGGQRTIFMHGTSGMGKTALTESFLDSLGQGQQAVVLRGRCYERESVPYKALDSLVDAISRYLVAMSAEDRQNLLFPEIVSLAKLFPVLSRIHTVTDMASGQNENLDHQELWRRAVGAFSKLLHRMAKIQPLVLYIDDVQWGDADSALLLADMLGQDQAPPILLLTSYRTEEAESSRFLQILTETIGFTELSVEALTQTEARDLAQALLEREQAAGEVDAGRIAQESGGSPFFVLELTRHFLERRYSQPEEGQELELTLDQVLKERCAELPASVRHLLNTIAVAGRPISQELAAQVTGLEKSDYRPLAILRHRHMVRTQGPRATDLVEIYHDRIREHVVAALSASDLQDCHRQLARHLEVSQNTDAEWLAVHLEGSGQLDRAVDYYRQAAEHAAQTLAFDRAAALYRHVIELKPPARGEVGLRVALGECLRNAGRGAEAAEVFLVAAEGADSATRLECQRQAAEQLLISGHLQLGLETIEKLLGETGVKMPPTPMRALLSLLWQRARLSVRGLRWREKQESQISAVNLTRLDVYKSVAHGLGIVDSIRGMDFQARGLLLALKVGERTRLARALFLESNFIASQGDKRSLARSQKLIDLGAHIAKPANSPYLEAWVPVCEGTLGYFGGHFSLAAKRLAAADEAFRELSGVAWETSTARLFRMWNLLRMGSFAEMTPLLNAYLKDAVHRGDLYAQTTLIRTCYRLSVATGRAEDPDRSLSGVHWIPPEGRYHLQHWFEFEALAELSLFQGRADTMLAESRRNGRGLKQSMILRLQIVRSIYRWLHARLLLASGSDLREVKPLVRSLERERTRFATVLAGLLRAAIAVQTGKPESARTTLTQVIKLAQEMDMHLHVAAAQRRLGELIGGDEGAATLAQADTWLAKQGVLDVVRMTEVIAPGFTPQPAGPSR